MNNIGLKLIISLQNATNFHEGPVKRYCRSRILDRFSDKLQTKIDNIRQDMYNKKYNSKEIDHFHILNENVNNIRDDPEKGDYHEDTNDHLSKIKCVVDLKNYDLSVMINGKDTNTIENKPFDSCFIKTKIKNAFYKVDFFPFVRHELDGNSNENDNLRKLKSDYITSTLDVKKIGFNNVFTTILSKAKNKIMKATKKDRVDDLIQKLIRRSRVQFCTFPWRQ